MLIDQQLLEILRCPLDHSPLSLAEDELLVQMNDTIRLGSVLNQGGQRLRQPIEGGLVREAGDVLYPILDGIPVMLPSEGVELSQLDQA